MNLYIAILRVVSGKFAFALGNTIANRYNRDNTKVLTLIIALALIGIVLYFNGWFNVFLILKPHLTSIIKPI